jgi:hypothetical protein
VFRVRVVRYQTRIKIGGVKLNGRSANAALLLKLLVTDRRQPAGPEERG